MSYPNIRVITVSAGQEISTDYKESEKLLGELASSIETIADECMILYRNTTDIDNLRFC
ncbi:hypothetical protein MNV_820005 [Candidatus Methanoperedens nitroreducens]|uniref:Uncharacterized protein n=1 Tax=Candidatus Methanoperedens nitratireducens TaxID=1392998 RepID=A0A284VTT8_9EURY|nr:hypothetical protein MNV_820005 [Candidatus Methanoperedens nitroreducens]